MRLVERDVLQRLDLELVDRPRVVDLGERHEPDAVGHGRRRPELAQVERATSAGRR